MAKTESEVIGLNDYLPPDDTGFDTLPRSDYELHTEAAETTDNEVIFENNDIDVQKNSWFRKIGRGSINTLRFPNKIVSMRFIATAAVVLTGTVFTSNIIIDKIHHTARVAGTEAADSFSDQLAKKKTAQEAAKGILALCEGHQDETGNSMSDIFTTGLCEMALEFTQGHKRPKSTTTTTINPNVQGLQNLYGRNKAKP